MMKLRDWVNIDKLNWYNLSLNPNAIEILNRIDWGILSANTNAIEILIGIICLLIQMP